MSYKCSRKCIINELIIIKLLINVSGIIFLSFYKFLQDRIFSREYKVLRIRGIARDKNAQTERTANSPSRKIKLEQLLDNESNSRRSQLSCDSLQKSLETAPFSDSICLTPSVHRAGERSISSGSVNYVRIYMYTYIYMYVRNSLLLPLPCLRP